MRLSEGQRLRDKIDTLKKEEGLTDKQVKQLFIKEYLMDEEEKDPDEIFGELLHGKKDNEE